MKNKSIVYILVTGIVAGALFTLFFSSLRSGPAQAGSSDNVSGWAWSETVGWISFNCTDGATCASVNYGVTVDPQNGNFSGYAWSDNVGWMKFDPVGPYPNQPNSSAKLSQGNNEVIGWARACAGAVNPNCSGGTNPNSGGWDGWIKLRKHASDGGSVPNYGVSVNSATGEFSGWAWGSDVVGWISFNCQDTGSCAQSNYKVVAANIFNQPPSTSPGSLQVTSANSADYCGVTAFPPVRVNWQFKDPNQGDTQSAFQIQIFQGGNLAVDTGKKTGSSQSYVFQLVGERLLWNTAYTWQVKVWDSKDASSSFTQGQNFTTPLHHFPVANFTFQPSSPGIGEQIQFQDQTTFGQGSTLKAWAWDFESDGTSDSTLQNPTHTYLVLGSFQVTLRSSDDVGSCTTPEAGNPKSITIGVSLPTWEEISPF